MSKFLRPDLNGSIITDASGQPALVLAGAARVIENESTIQALFGPRVKSSIGSVNDIVYGRPLNDGCCLIRAVGGADIFLLAGLPDTRRHHITSYDSFLLYGFNMEGVVSLPWLAIQAIPAGFKI